jgi:hypothetical protein
MSTRLVIGTPCYGGNITNLYALSLLKLQQACLARGIDFGAMLLSGDALITRARQNLVAHFLSDPDATHLLFIDADIGFGPEQVFRLLDFGADMAAAIYPTKRLDPERFRTLANEGHPNPEAGSLQYVIEYDLAGATEMRDGFIRVRYAGTGFLLMQRAALLAMIEHYPELRYKSEHQADDPLRESVYRSALFNCFIDQTTGIYLSEDFSFCRRWTDMGGAIWADTHSQLSHMGPFTYRGNFRASFGGVGS